MSCSNFTSDAYRVVQLKFRSRGNGFFDIKRYRQDKINYHVEVPPSKPEPQDISNALDIDMLKEKDPPKPPLPKLSMAQRVRAARERHVKNISEAYNDPYYKELSDALPQYKQENRSFYKNTT